MTRAWWIAAWLWWAASAVSVVAMVWLVMEAKP
jgi:hypothetical protein